MIKLWLKGLQFGSAVGEVLKQTRSYCFKEALCALADPENPGGCRARSICFFLMKAVSVPMPASFKHGQHQGKTLALPVNCQVV
jgi:hypothetical protein